MKLDTQTSQPLQTGTHTPRRQRLSTKMRVTLGALVVCVLLLGAFGGYLLLRPQVQPLKLPKVPAQLTLADIGLADWQQYQQPAPADPLHSALLPEKPQVTVALASIEDAAGLALVHEGQLEPGLAYLKAAVQASPDNLRYANDYRITLRDHKRYQEEEQFFSQLLKAHTSVNLQLDLALSYVDEMRSCPTPPDGLVCQAQFSSRSVSLLDIALEKQPYNIVARYARGLNNLYWPTLMGHLPQSQTDLQYAVSLLTPLNAMRHSFTPEAYAALGDVFAKSSKLDDARNVWLNGQRVAPDAAILKQRLSIPRDQLVNDEDSSLRGLGVYVDTDIALFWSATK
jgi:hypothetical protein